jgi:DICT domain-containing protein
MSLNELIAGVEDHEKTLSVFNADASAVEALREQLHDRNLTVSESSTDSGKPASFAVLADEGSFVTAVDVGEVLAPDADTEPAFDDAAYSPILDHLDETLFTSYDIGQMVAASREIEDRAWRIGSGTLYSGFQTLSILTEQLDVYERLAAGDQLEVHAYAAPDADVPDHDSDLTIHVERTDEIRRSWFVVYDGAGIDINKCALLAEEREKRSFYGFWTYDPSTVKWIVDHLESTYGLVEPA